MRKSLCTLLLVLLSLATLSFTTSKRTAGKQPSTVVTPQPGSRCTKLTYEDGNKPRPQLSAAAPGTRCARLTHGPRAKEAFLPNTAPKVGLSQSTANLHSAEGTTVQLTAVACDREDDNLLYTYSTTGGRITGDGANTSWDLGGVQPGTYTVSVEVDDGCGCITFSSGTVTVKD